MADDWLDKFRAMAGAHADPDAWLLEQIEQLHQALQDGDMEAVKLHAGRVAFSHPYLVERLKARGPLTA